MKERRTSKKLLHVPGLQIWPTPQFAVAEGISSSGIFQFADRISRSSSFEPPPNPIIKKLLLNAANRLTDIFDYWHEGFAPSKVAIEGAFKDLAKVINTLQRAQSSAHQDGSTKIQVRLDRFAREVSELRTLARTIGLKLEGGKRFSEREFAQLSEKFALELNRIRIEIEQYRNNMLN